MSTVTFDTLELVERLVKSGIDQKQAEAVVQAIARAQEALVTKQDLEIALQPIKTDLAVMNGRVVGGRGVLGHESVFLT